ncbi:MAG TPA: gluconokinase [Candidatus Acidoferrum sp.]|jgi:gluconokinase|nr:gluconokinase [Candidatus Acidoferrum sp.]
MIVIVMGVVGAGKTTVGSLLAHQLDWDFADADDYHPRSNVEKIREGIALTDADRAPWLQLLRDAIDNWIAEKRSVVLACSALKRAYRQILCAGPDVRFVYLKGNPALIAERLHSRHGHFANEQILSTQMVDLEEPDHAITVEISLSPLEIVTEIRKALRLE